MITYHNMFVNTHGIWKKWCSNFSVSLYLVLFSPFSTFRIECSDRIETMSFSFCFYLPFYSDAPKQSSAQQKQMDEKFQKRWDFKTTNLFGSSLAFSFPWKQEFAGIYRHDRNPPLLCYCCPLSVSKEMDFRTCLHLIKEPSHLFFSYAFLFPTHLLVLMFHCTTFISFFLLTVLLRAREQYSWKLHRDHLAQTNSTMTGKMEEWRSGIYVKRG